MHKDLKNFTKFFRNKISENLRKFQSFCEKVKHCEYKINVTVFCKIIKLRNLFKNYKIFKTIPTNLKKILIKICENLTKF